MLYLVLRSTSWQLKKWFRIPISDLPFFIRVAILVSSFSSREMKDPKYLNYSVKWIHFSLGRLVLLGMSLSFRCLMESLMKVGKYIASDFVLPFWSPTCIVRPNFLK